jgi:DNA mismatch endonuclease (patch repair protein)
VSLRRALYALGLRYRVARADLPGCPDVVFAAARVAVFCDGDFWHGRGLEQRVAKLQRGHNAPYWVAKIRRNVERDRATDVALRADGWEVLRYWESDIRANPAAIADAVHRVVTERRRAGNVRR